MEVELKNLLRTLVQKDGSDLYLNAGMPPSAKFSGVLTPLSDVKLTGEDTKRLAYSIMDEDQTASFEANPEMNIAIAEVGIGRFRVNIYQHKNHTALVIRNIKIDIPDLEVLGLPEILKKVIMTKRGLILFVGATGSGKSTSMASLLDFRNRNSKGHIITIEDPVEYIHEHKGCVISQREVGIDTHSYEEALKNTLRQAPDVILIGEIRSRETMEHALAFAETGHLCLSTLHANNANQAMDRIINFFPDEKRKQLLLDLSLNLKAFVSQRLVPKVNGGRVAAIEILLGTARACDLIHKGEIHELKELMSKSRDVGMQTFDNHLVDLCLSGKISMEDAVSNADSPNNVQLQLNLVMNTGVSVKRAGLLSLEMTDEERHAKANGLK